MFVAKYGTFLEKEFLDKGVSGRKIELDEVVDPSLQIPSSTTEAVPKPLSNMEEEPNDDDQSNNIETPEVHRSTRICATPDWYSSLVMSVLLDEQK